MRATELWVNAPDAPVRGGEMAFPNVFASGPLSILLPTLDGGTMQVDWYPFTGTWFVVTI